MLADTPPLVRGLPKAARGAAGRLRDALLALAGGHAAILAHSEKTWASITFAGTRHRLELEFAGEAAIQAGEMFIVFLPEHEFMLPGQLVADAAVTAVDHRLVPEPRLTVSVELLLLDEG
jgi:hypothetical protein